MKWLCKILGHDWERESWWYVTATFDAETREQTSQSVESLSFCKRCKVKR